MILGINYGKTIFQPRLSLMANPHVPYGPPMPMTAAEQAMHHQLQSMQSGMLNQGAVAGIFASGTALGAQQQILRAQHAQHLNSVFASGQMSGVAAGINASDHDQYTIGVKSGKALATIWVVERNGFEQESGLNLPAYKIKPVNFYGVDPKIEAEKDYDDVKWRLELPMLIFASHADAEAYVRYVCARIVRDKASVLRRGMRKAAMFFGLVDEDALDFNAALDKYLGKEPAPVECSSPAQENTDG